MTARMKLDKTVQKKKTQNMKHELVKCPNNNYTIRLADRQLSTADGDKFI